MATEQIPNYFFTQGVLGFIVVVLAIVVIRLYMDNKSLQDKLALVAEQRRLDYVGVLKDNNEIITGVSTNLRIMAEKIEISKGKKQ